MFTSGEAVTVRMKVKSTGTIEEIKTTRADVAALHQHAGATNEAQLKIYGAMLFLEQATLLALNLKLVYLHPDEPGETVFDLGDSRHGWCTSIIPGGFCDCVAFTLLR